MDQKRCVKNNKYDLLWEKKIKEDFNVTSEGSYEKYKSVKQLYEKTLYIVSIIDEYLPDSSYMIFDSEEKAERYIYSRLGGNFSYSAMKTALMTYSLRYGSVTYQLEEVRLNNGKTKYDDIFTREKEEYEKTREKLNEIDKDMSILADIEDFITDFNSDKNSLHVPEAKVKIPKFVKKLDEKFKLGDNKKEMIKTLILDSLFLNNKTKEMIF